MVKGYCVRLVEYSFFFCIYSSDFIVDPWFQPVFLHGVNYEK